HSSCEHSAPVGCIDTLGDGCPADVAVRPEPSRAAGKRLRPTVGRGSHFTMPNLANLAHDSRLRVETTRSGRRSRTSLRYKVAVIETRPATTPVPECGNRARGSTKIATVVVGLCLRPIQNPIERMTVYGKHQGPCPQHDPPSLGRVPDHD